MELLLSLLGDLDLLEDLLAPGGGDEPLVADVDAGLCFKLMFSLLHIMELWPKPPQF